ncbi:hypothetical protein C8R42DRAFT_690697, partial [Lentinula raphanica]
SSFSGSHFLAAGETFDGPIPQPETFPLLRFDDTIASANTSRLQLVGLIGAQVTDGANTSSTRVSLDFNTIQDLTSQVKVSGNSTTVSWTPFSNGPNPGSWGSWAIDHFSPKGMWEDSMEYQAQRHGYEVNVTLPVLHTLPSNAQMTPNQTFDYGTTFNWDKFTEDYQDTLTSLYLDYMNGFSEWSHSIGMSYSNQSAYNLRLDTAASAAIPAAPEIESFGVPTIDRARQLSGGVHLGNRTIFSSELGARVYEANSIRMVELLQDANTQYAGGVNVVMLHGFPYSGYYPNTTWPGFTTVGYVFADMHGPRMPAWDHYKDYLVYLARTQYALQAGVVKVDIGIYRKGYDIDFTSPPYAGTSQLISSGYTYEYVSPENLNLPGVTVSNSRLAPYGPAYKAFILGRQQNITIDAARRLVDDIPGYEIGNASIIMLQVQFSMSQLTAEPTVVVVDDEDGVPSTLVSLGVLPVVSSEPWSLTLFSVVLQTNDKSGTKTAFFFLFNQGNSAINTTLTLDPAFTGSPFALDPWTRLRAISIPAVSLASNQTALFAVTSGTSFEGVPVPDVHITSAEHGVTAVVSNTYTSSSRHLQLRSLEPGSKQIITRAGERKIADFSLKGESSRVLSGWRLNITAWTTPEDLSEPQSVLVRHSPIDLTEGLVPWNQIDGLANVSGVGTYVTFFEWAHAKDGAVGLLLDFGEIFHTVRAWLNGRQITTADPAHPVVDISDLVVYGSNTKWIDAARTLLNAINAVPEVEMLGQRRLSILLTLPESQQNGLISNVTFVPYAR